MGISSVLIRQRFGVGASLTIAAIFWLSTTTVSYCLNAGEGIESLRCKSDSIVTFIIDRQNWPYQHLPFFGYWDSYDNKLAAIVYEPYSQLATGAAIAYLLWLWIAMYIKKRDEQGIATSRGAHISPTTMT
ncbi:MAG: hypothetical protein MN733_34215 [Nitrososphaera sp.]|nr:hypothetical protein [Nitrososphaera sp.]